MRRCPFCAEDIQEAAIRCRWCGGLVAPVPARRAASPGEFLGIEPVEWSRRYFLGAGEDFFGIWDRLEPADPVVKYPDDDDGLDQALEEFGRLKRETHDGPVRRLGWLGRVFFALLGLWVATGVFLSTMFFWQPGASFWVDVVQWAYVVDNLAFRGWILLLVVQVALWLRATYGARPPRVVAGAEGGQGG